MSVKLDFAVMFIRGKVISMKNKNTVSLLCLSTASIAGGMAFKDKLDYSMVIGVGLAIIFLLAAGYLLGKKSKGNNSHN
jgi:hypothetical protein